MIQIPRRLLKRSFSQQKPPNCTNFSGLYSVFGLYNVKICYLSLSGHKKTLTLRLIWKQQDN